MLEVKFQKTPQKLEEISSEGQIGPIPNECYAKFLDSIPKFPLNSLLSSAIIVLKIMSPHPDQISKKIFC